MNKERIFKRVLSLVLSLAMAAALLPTGLLGGRQMPRLRTR